MTAEHLNPLCALSLENEIVRKLSYDKSGCEYVASKKKKKRVFCKMCFMYYALSYVSK